MEQIEYAYTNKNKILFDFNLRIFTELIYEFLKKEITSEQRTSVVHRKEHPKFLLL